MVLVVDMRLALVFSRWSHVVQNLVSSWLDVDLGREALVGFENEMRCCLGRRYGPIYITRVSSQS